MNLDTILKAQALRYPEKHAVIFGHRRLAYQELDQHSDRFASSLRARGLRDGDRVLFLLNNSIAFVEAFFGVLKAGGIVVPVNTHLTQQEIAFIARDCMPSVIIFDAARRAVIKAAAADVSAPLFITLGEPEADEVEIGDLISSDAPSIPSHSTRRFDDCMICYTSGTTGRPKGAIITHSNLIVASLLNAAEWRTGPEDRFIVTTPLAHRTGLARLTDALFIGATLVIMSKFNPVEMIAAVERERITVMGMVPTVTRLIMPEIERDPRRCESLRVFLVTGEAFPLKLKTRLMALLPQAKLHSFFAMTETGVVTRLGPEEQLSHGASIGRPSPGVEVRLIDDLGNDVAAGEAGELLVRSGEPGRYIVMRGYYARPDETAAALNDGWFATGDLAQVDADGYLYIVDRKKDMIKRGGYNIYSKEVELALQSHPAVHDAAVVGAPDDVFGERVIAVVELKPGMSARESDLIEHCRTLIASYKKPKRIYLRPLPRNALGKVLKFALREELRSVMERPDE